MLLPIPGIVAVIGRSGAGKSTLVHSVLGLLEPSAGSIRLGSPQLESSSHYAWRRAFGYVPQETILFHASISENLRIANPHASLRDLERATRRANALEFIESLAEGFDTVIGDQGVKLSGGQRQRLCIARALISNPSILLMDEAMSALDTESEADLLRTLDELRKEMGILIVTHRLSSVEHADSICVMEAGRVVESGTWDELMSRPSRLQSLVEVPEIVGTRPFRAMASVQK
jgi:ATP-binding cassette subfamily C protein